MVSVRVDPHEDAHHALSRGAEGCTDVAMEATGVYWKPVRHILEARFQPAQPSGARAGNVTLKVGRSHWKRGPNWPSDQRFEASGVRRARVSARAHSGTQGSGSLADGQRFSLAKRGEAGET